MPMITAMATIIFYSEDNMLRLGYSVARLLFYG